MSREGRDVEHDIDVNDHADAYYIVDDNLNVRFAVCKHCLHVVCECPQEPPTSRLRNYKPAAPRHIRDDNQ